MANGVDYESIFGADFAVIRAGLEAMPDNVESMLLSRHIKISGLHSYNASYAGLLFASHI